VKDVQLLCLPGVGADHRLFYRQENLPYTLIEPDYCPIEGAHDLRSYSLLFADKITPLLDPKKPVVILGMSLGGAVGLEIAEKFGAKGLILCGSLVHPKEIRPWLTWLGRHFANKLPKIFYSLLNPLIPIVMRVISRVAWRDILLCQQMYHDLDKGLFRDLCYWLCRWPGKQSTIPVLRIHGRDDQVILSRRLMMPSEIVPRAKHLVGMSYWQLVNERIVSWIESL
jgi:pimeloyl-ACP methyl ester carboxylesterase